VFLEFGHLHNVIREWKYVPIEAYGADFPLSHITVSRWQRSKKYTVLGLLYIFEDFKIFLKSIEHFTSS
jgi:hypothetical protein